MLVDVVMPQLGESIAEGTILKWHKKVGDTVRKDETLLEISTDKVDSEIPAPASGTLQEILVEEGKTVEVGTVLARIATGAEEKVETPPLLPEKDRTQPVEKREEGRSVLDYKKGERVRRFLSPVVRAIAQKEGIPLEVLETLPGSGKGGRLRKQDLLAYLERREREASRSAAVQEAPEIAAPSEPSARTGAADRVRRVPMDHIRKAIAEHMIRSVRTSAHVTSVHEVDVTGMMEYLARHGDEFLHREGVKLTPTAFFVQAAAKALREFPVFNASIEGEDILYHQDINIGVAVAMESGLIVPVVRHADELSLTGIARTVADLANRARNKKLSPDEVQGGTFSISNYGVFDTLIGTPIINQPQVAILGTGAAKQRPVIVDGMIAIRWIMYLSLTFDHRIADGAQAGRFLQRITELLQEIRVED
jgi:2-oxoglutarate dehydrogenase E2 component (dihydrolipoamide succinyltransferase)